MRSILWISSVSLFLSLVALAFCSSFCLSLCQGLGCRLPGGEKMMERFIRLAPV